MVPAKLEIVRDYGKEYSRILAKQELLSHAYIDAFTGPGVHVLRTTGEMVVGSPVNALEISPPFADYYFIDTDGDKVGALRRLAGGPPGVHIFQGDCNELLPENVYPHVRYENYRGRLFGSKTRSKQRKVIEGELRAARPGQERCRTRPLPLQDALRDSVERYGKHPRLHPVCGGEPRREALGDGLCQCTAHPDCWQAGRLRGASAREGSRRLRRTGRPIE